MSGLHRQLLTACVRGRQDAALSLLDQHPGLLNEAWIWGMFEVEGKCIERKDTALIASSKGGDAELVLALIERGANPNLQNMDSVSATMGASRYGSIAALKVLLDNGADLHAKTSSGLTALHVASAWYRTGTCELLLSRGADLLAKDKNGRTALDILGLFSDSRPTAKAKAQALSRMHAAWEAGPHPSLPGIRWARRWPFVRVLVCWDFQPTAARRAKLALLHPPLPPDAVIPRLPCTTLAERRALLRDKVFTHPGLWKKIALFL